MTWQPIKTGPKDGTRVLATNAKYTATARYRHSPYTDLRGFVFDGATMPNDSITHWMPLPAPPSSRGG